MVSKLRIDADLRYCYTGEQKLKGAPRKYDGKVDLSDLSRLELSGELADAKQFSGLCDCQSRQQQSLDFHFNASLAALNIAKLKQQQSQLDTSEDSQPQSFSMTMSMI